ncbi:ABC transporter ATP-binding protein [Cohnella sp. 56]|uniref:ABC transporter ATP-binding protein n=1 Tax=Cohnella sp. 56 TaxID=3113722 RepID=UPI0030EB0A77
MRELIRYLRPYRAASILAPLLMVLEVAMDLLQPRFMAGIVNDGVVGGRLGAIWQHGTWMVGAALVGLIGGVGCTVFSTFASQGFGMDLRNALFRKVQTFSFRNLDELTTGSLVTRLTADVAQLQNMVMISQRMLVRDGCLFAGSLIMAFLISPKLALLCLAALPPLIVILIVTLRRSGPLFLSVQQKLDRVNTVVQENLSGIRVVKAFVRAAFERGRFGLANRDNRDAAIRAARVVALNGPIMTLLLNVCIVAALWLGGRMTDGGGLAVGSLAAFITYMSTMMFSLAGLGNQIVNISRARASAGRVNEVLRTAPDMADPEKPEVAEAPGLPMMLEATGVQSTAEAYDNADDNADANANALAFATAPASAAVPASPGRILFEHVSFAYPTGDRDVLRDVSLAIEPGWTVGILGATGSGKSTLVSLIPRLYDPSAGRVTIGDTDVRDIPADRLRRDVGLVLQQAILFSGTIRDNIRYGRPEATQEDVESAARAAEAHGFISRLPEGYDTVVGQRGVNLSGGQKQRLSIARALLLRPRILILDDSTSAVDLATEARIQAALRERMQGSTCLVIAQRISSVMEADRIFVLDDGRIAAAGTHEELLRDSAIYRDIYESQRGQEALTHV